MKIIIALFFLFLALFAHETIDLTQKEKEFIKNHPTIILGSDSNWSPYIIQNEDGTISGYDKDILEQVSKNTGLNFTLQTARWKEMLEKAKTKEIDGLSTSAAHKKREEYFNFSKPYVSTQRLLIVSNTNPKQIKTIEDLKGIRLGYQEKNLFDKKIVSRYKDVTLVPLKSLEEVLNSLITGKIDATIGSHAIIYMANKKNLPYIKTIASVPDSTLELVFSIRKDFPEAVSILNKGLDSISESEKLFLSNKWFFYPNGKEEFNREISLTKEEQEYLNNKDSLKVAHLKEFYPFTFFNELNEPVGYSVDILKSMGELLNKDIEFISEPWRYQLEMLDKKEIDLLPFIAKTKVRESSIDFTQFSHISFVIGFATNKKNAINSMDSFKDKKLAVVKSSFMYEHLKKTFPQIQLLAVDNVEKGIEAVVRDEAYAMLDNVTTLNYFIKEGWLKQLKISYVDDLQLPHKIKLHMGVKKGNDLLKSILEKANTKISKAQKDQLKVKWFGKEASVAFKLTKEETEYLKSKSHLSVMSLKNFQPFSFRKQGEPLGYSIDLMKLVGEKLDKEIKFVKLPWKNQLELLKEGNLDVIPHIAINEERKKFVDYTEFTHLTFLIGFATDKNQDINSMEDLKDKKIAVVNKYYLHDHLKKQFPEIELFLAKSTQEAVEAVAQGKAFAVVDNIPTLNYFIQEKWLSNLKITSVDDFGLPLETQMPMGVTKGNTHLKSILEKVNNSLTLEEKNRIKSKWFTTVTTNETIKKPFLEFTQKEQEYFQKKQKIKMCIDPDWMPFEKIEDGKHIGMSADYLAIMQQSLPIEIQLVPTKTWTESLEFGKERKCDIFSLVMPTPERLKIYKFTKPYMSVPIIIATTINQPFINNIPSIVDKKIGIVKGYAYGEILRDKYPEMDLVEVKNVQDGLDKVKAEELFGFIGTLSTVGFNIQNNYIGSLKIAGKFDDTWDLGIGVRNDEPILRDIFDKLIDTITTKEKQDILNKWVSINYQKGIDYTIVWQVSIVFLIIIALALYKNRTISNLNTQIQEQQDMVNKYVLIQTTDNNGNITDVNEAYEKAVGYTKEELIGKRHSFMRHPDMDGAIFKDMWKTISEDKPWRGEVKNLRKDNSVIYLNLYIEPILKDNKRIGYRAISEDITDKKRVEQLSITDQLTQLYNRLKLEEVFKVEIERERRYDHPLSAILLDIDYFKSVNDNYGHDVGDEVLKAIANIIKQSIRSSDTVGRWGGEEFLIIVPETTLEDTIKLANKIRENIEVYPFEKIGQKTASFGVATLEENDNQDTLVKKADEALYKAKEKGRNRVEKV